MACQTIAFGRGVCGAAATTQTTQLVEDVEKFPGHIACDGASRSEVVVPIVKDGQVCFFVFADRGVDMVLTERCVGRCYHRHRLRGAEWLYGGGPGGAGEVGEVVGGVVRFPAV